MSASTCTACGPAGQPCCTAKGVQPCDDGQTCGGDHKCPVTPPKDPGWSGEACGYPKACNGTLTCVNQKCACAQPDWSQCTLDGKSVCAPTDAPTKFTGNCTAEQWNGCASGQYACYDGPKPPKGECNPDKNFFQNVKDCNKYCLRP